MNFKLCISTFVFEFSVLGMVELTLKSIYPISFLGFLLLTLYEVSSLFIQFRFWIFCSRHGCTSSKVHLSKLIFGFSDSGVGTTSRAFLFHFVFGFLYLEWLFYVQSLFIQFLLFDVVLLEWLYELQSLLMNFTNF